MKSLPPWMVQMFMFLGLCSSSTKSNSTRCPENPLGVAETAAPSEETKTEMPGTLETLKLCMGALLPATTVVSNTHRPAQGRASEWLKPTSLIVWTVVLFSATSLILFETCLSKSRSKFVNRCNFCAFVLGLALWSFGVILDYFSGLSVG